MMISSFASIKLNRFHMLINMNHNQRSRLIPAFDLKDYYKVYSRFVYTFANDDYTFCLKLVYVSPHSRK